MNIKVRENIRDQIFIMLCAAAAIFPILIVIMNSMKSRKAIFTKPYGLPDSTTLSFVGYETVHKRSNFLLYYANSAIVTVIAILLIIFLGAMVAFAFTQYDFKGKNLLRIFFFLAC